MLNIYSPFIVGVGTVNTKQLAPGFRASVCCHSAASLSRPANLWAAPIGPWLSFRRRRTHSRTACWGGGTTHTQNYRRICGIYYNVYTLLEHRTPGVCAPTCHAAPCHVASIFRAEILTTWRVGVALSTWIKTNYHVSETRKFQRLRHVI